MSTVSRLFTWRTAIAESDLPPTARLVAFALSLWMNEMGGSAWPSVETLEKATGLSDRSVQRGLNTLTECGYLLIDHGGKRQRVVDVKGHTTRTSVYQAAIPKGDTVSPLEPEGDRVSPKG